MSREWTVTPEAYRLVRAWLATAPTDASDDDALQARARRLQPINWQESTEWHDSNEDSNAWVAPTRRNPLLAKTWARGNCLKACISSLLAADVSRVPDPTGDFAHEGWFGRYSQRLEEATGHRLEKLPAYFCPPRDPNRLWVAVIREDGPDDHSVVARGPYVVHDPAGSYMGNLPMDRLVDGMLVVPTKRVVPVLSPRGSGYTVVAA